MMRVLLLLVVVAGCAKHDAAPTPHNTATASAPALDPAASAAVQRDGHCLVEADSGHWKVNGVVVDEGAIAGLCKLGHDKAVVKHYEGDLPTVDWQQMERDLKAAGVEYTVKVRGDCMNNPLAEGCS